jgi:hypothetical protein
LYVYWSAGEEQAVSYSHHFRGVFGRIGPGTASTRNMRAFSPAADAAIDAARLHFQAHRLRRSASGVLIAASTQRLALVVT